MFRQLARESLMFTKEPELHHYGMAVVVVALVAVVCLLGLGLLLFS